MTAIAPSIPGILKLDPTFCQGQSDIQAGLMVVTVATSILSLIPGCRMIGAIAMRSVALISSLDLCQETWQRADWRKRLSTCTKLAATALCLTAVATSSSGLLIAGLVGDVAVQIFEILRLPRGGKKNLHYGFLAVNVLVLTGIALASWEIMLVASVISGAAMIVLGVYVARKNVTWKDRVISLSYIALAGIGIGSAVTVSRVTGWVPYGHYEPVYAENWITGGQYLAGHEFVQEGVVLRNFGKDLPIPDWPTLPLGGQVAADILKDR